MGKGQTGFGFFEKEEHCVLGFVGTWKSVYQGDTLRDETHGTIMAKCLCRVPANSP